MKMEQEYLLSWKDDDYHCEQQMLTKACGGGGNRRTIGSLEWRRWCSHYCHSFRSMPTRLRSRHDEIRTRFELKDSLLLFAK